MQLYNITFSTLVFCKNMFFFHWNAVVTSVIVNSSQVFITIYHTLVCLFFPPLEAKKFLDWEVGNLFLVWKCLHCTPGGIQFWWDKRRSVVIEQGLWARHHECVELQSLHEEKLNYGIRLELEKQTTNCKIMLNSSSLKTKISFTVVVLCSSFPHCKDVWHRLSDKPSTTWSTNV